MEEIEKLHSEDLEWNTIMELGFKIGELEDKIDGHWDELVDMVVEAIESEEDKGDSISRFFNLYTFLFRLYYRLRNNLSKREFNQVSKLNIAGKEHYRLTNYDYKTFKWAKSGGFVNGISNDCIDIPADKLTTNQRRAFDRRIGK